MSDLIGNPVDWFSHVAVHMYLFVFFFMCLPTLLVHDLPRCAIEINVYKLN